MRLITERRTASCSKCAFMCVGRSTQSYVNILKYVYTQAPHSKKVIRWAYGIPAPATRKKRKKKKKKKCHLNTASQLRVIPSIITILFVKRKGLKMTTTMNVEWERIYVSAACSRIIKWWLLSDGLRSAPQIFDSVKKWNVKVWDWMYDCVHVVLLF